MEKIVLLEFYEEFSEFQKYIRSKGLDISEFSLVALNLKLQAHLKKSGIKFSNTLPFFGNASIERILLKFDDINKYINENFDFQDANGVRNAYKAELLHYLELIVNYIGWILEILINIYNTNKNIELYACAKKHISSSVLISNDRILGMLVEKFAIRNNLKFHLFGQEMQNDTKIPSGDETSKKNSQIYLFFFKLLKFYLKLFYKTRMLIPTTGYGFKKLLSGIKMRNRGLLFIIPYNIEDIKWYKIYGGLLTGILNGKAFIDINAFSDNRCTDEQNAIRRKVTLLLEAVPAGLYDFCGIDCSSIIRNKVKIAVTEHLCRMVRKSHQLFNLVKQFDISMFMSPFGRDISYIAAELLKKMGKVSMFISNGTHPVPINQYHEISIFNMCRGFMLGDYSHVAVGTPVHEAHLHYFKAKYKWIKNVEVKTGPLIFANLNGINRSAQKRKLGLSQDEVILTHATSTKIRGSERYYFLETPDELFTGLSDIIDTVNMMKNTRLIIRIHPGFYLSDEEVIMLLPASNKYIINRKGPFTDVLAATDILISYSSTTIDEALLNRIPVLLYDKWNRYNHFQTGIYENPESENILPVCYVNNKKKLGEALDFMIKKTVDVKAEDMDLRKYKYQVDYTEAFYRFIGETFNAEGGGK